jgi:putative transposase
MSRPLRCEFPGGWYHVTARGNERKNIFRDERDREHFVALLAELEARFELEVHAFVLMDNHYHLLLRLRRKTGLSAGMQYLGVSYSVWFNRRHRRSGHLFQGRFKAVVVDSDTWGAELSRYIHLNPVRTKRHGLDKRSRAADREGLGEEVGHEEVARRLAVLRQHRWSSYPAYVGRGKGPAWLHTAETLAKFGQGSRGSREYRRYVEEAIRHQWAESPWENLVGGLVLGGKELLEKVRQVTKADPGEQPGWKQIERRPGLPEIVAAVSRLRGEAWDDFGNRRGDWGRPMVLMAARRLAGIDNRALADWMGGKDDSAVTQAVKRLETKMQESRKLAGFYRSLTREMSNVKM